MTSLIDTLTHVGTEIVQWLEHGVELFFYYANLVIGHIVSVFEYANGEVKERAKYLVEEAYQVTSRLPDGEVRVVPVRNETDHTLTDFYVMEKNVIKVLRQTTDTLSRALQNLCVNESKSSKDRQ